MSKLNFPRIRQFTVTTTAQQVLKENKQRKAVLIYNNGTAPVELLDNKKQTYGKGIPILAGTAYDNEHFNPQGEYWIICESGTEDIRIEEDIQQDA